MSTLTRYLNRMLLVRFLVIFFAVGGFAVLLDLLEVGAKVAHRTEGSPASLAWYALIRLPSLVADLIPLTVLLASLATMFDLVRRRELVVIWSGGVSRWGLMLRLLPVALLLSACKFAVDNWAIPRTMPLIRELGVLDSGPVVGATADWFWLRSGDDVIRLPAEAAGLTQLHDVLIFHRDPQGRLVEQLAARSAEVEAGGWLLKGVIRRPASASPATEVAELYWPVGVDTSMVETMAKLPRELPLLDLLDVLVNGGYGIADIEGHRTWLHGRLAGAANVILMALLGVALARRFSRYSIAFRLFGEGLLIGFLTMTFQGILLAFGEVGLLTPEVAAWLVPAGLCLFIIFWGEIGSPRQVPATS